MYGKRTRVHGRRVPNLLVRALLLTLASSSLCLALTKSPVKHVIVLMMVRLGCLSLSLSLSLSAPYPLSLLLILLFFPFMFLSVLSKNTICNDAKSIIHSLISFSRRKIVRSTTFWVT